MRLKHNIDSSFADIFNPKGGRITTVNDFNLLILHWLQFNAERGVLNINAYNIVYVAIGNERVEIVSKNREAIFDDQVQEGQVITVPQNHAVLKKAGRQGFEWIAFKTKANAKISQLVCSLSVMRGLPVDVLSNSFVISWEEASKFEENKHKVSVFSPRRGSQE
ncbi:hypothetical protein V6N13_091135 [Hibiscus sabdariffa]